jgi:hypothetical protein
MWGFDAITNLLSPKLDSDFGLVINWDFHTQKKWVSALTPYLVDAIVAEFNPIIIDSQRQYNRYKKQLKYIVSVEPGWAAPILKFDTNIEATKAVFYSDPHLNTDFRRKYFFENNFSYVFSYYHSPFFYHLPDFPPEKFVHMPWAIPDQFINVKAIEQRNTDVVIFGGKGSDAYDVRNWCREQPGIINYNNSGVENKKMTDEEYFAWLSEFDAIVAAGSSNPKYDLVTPKYFEIASAGALLFGQHCTDLEKLGFNDSNSVIFTKENFLDLVNQYKQQPEQYLAIREQGRELIKSRHKVSDRIATMKSVFFNQ